MPRPFFRISDDKLLQMLESVDMASSPTSVRGRAAKAALARLQGLIEFKAEVTKACRGCDYDEAEGGLVNHCPNCCKRIATAAWAFVHGLTLVSGTPEEHGK